MARMDFRTLWLTTPVKSRHTMARRAGTSYKYLQKLAGQFGSPSLHLAAKLAKLYPELDIRTFIDPPKKVLARPVPPPAAPKRTRAPRP